MSASIPLNLIREMHPSNTIKLEDINSQTLIKWKCEKDHEWDARYHSRLAGTGCPYCKNRKLLTGFNDLLTVNPKLASEWNWVKNGDLTPDKVLYGSAKSVYWICNKGHEWKTTIEGRNSRSTGCPYCSGNRMIAGVNDLLTQNPGLSKEWHSTRNAPLLPNQISAKNTRKVWWLGTCGHEWQSTIAKRNVLGRGCPYCSGQKLLQGFNDLQTTHPDIAKEWDIVKNKLKPSEVITGGKEKFWWICSKNHEWQSNINKRKGGSKCPVCLNQKIVAGVNDLLTTNKDLALEWDYVKNKISIYEIAGGSNKKVYWIGKNCGHSWIASVNERNGPHKTGCPKCPKSASSSELEILNYVSELLPGAVVESNTRKAVPGFELDIYIPHLRLAFEYNGLYWHSEEIQKDNEYHYKKWSACKTNNIDLVYIWEDDYSFNKEGIISNIYSLLKSHEKNSPSLEETFPVYITYQEAEHFLQLENISNLRKNTIFLGLKLSSDNSLIAVMLFNLNYDKNQRELNIIKYHENISVLGCFGKLVKYAIHSNPDISKITTVSSNGSLDELLYQHNGLSLIGEAPVSYSYIIKGKRVLNHTKAGNDSINAQSDYEIRKIWDAGKRFWAIDNISDISE